MLPQLSQRLLTIANMVSQDSFVVDIGTDHGLLPIYLLCSDRVSKAYAVDKSPKALLQAKKKTSLYFQSITIAEPFKVMDLSIYIIQSRLLYV